MKQLLHVCFVFGLVCAALVLCGCGATGSTREYAKGLVEDLKLEMDEQFRKLEGDISANRRSVEGPGAVKDELAQVNNEIAALRTLTAQERVELKADFDRLGLQLGKLQAQLITLETKFTVFERALVSVLKVQRDAVDKALFDLQQGGSGTPPGK